MMKRMMITETELLNVAGGLSPDEMDSLLDMRMKLMDMLSKGEISSEEYNRQMDIISEMLRRPGCVFTS